MLRTDLDILDYISKQPKRSVLKDDLEAFIGENADRRLSEMKSARLIRYNPHWYDSGKPTYTIDAKGEDLLANHKQELEKECQRNAEARAEQERREMETRKEASRDRRVVLISAIVSAIVSSILGPLAAVLFQTYFR